MVFTLKYVLYSWRCTGADCGWAPGFLSGARICPAPPWWLWARCSRFFCPFSQGAISCCLLWCYLDSALLYVGCFWLLPAALGRASVLPFCVVGPRSWAGFPCDFPSPFHWTLRFGVSRYSLRKPGDYDFIPFMVESNGRQCTATHTLLTFWGALSLTAGVTKECESRVRPCLLYTSPSPRD